MPRAAKPPKIPVVAALGEHAVLFDLKDVAELDVVNISSPRAEGIRQSPHIYFHSEGGYSGVQREMCNPRHRMHVYPAIEVNASLAVAITQMTNEQRTQAAVRSIQNAWQTYQSLAYRPHPNYLDPTDTVTIAAMHNAKRLQAWLDGTPAPQTVDVSLASDFISIRVGDVVVWDTDSFYLAELRLQSLQHELAARVCELTVTFSDEPELECPACAGFTAEHVHEDSPGPAPEPEQEDAGQDTGDSSDVPGSGE